MNTQKKPIALVLGLRGQLHWAQALSEEFKRPVVGIVNWARLNESLSESDKSIFSRIYSFPDYYMQNRARLNSLTREEIDNQQRAIECSLTIENGSYITHYDRALRTLPDYMRVRRFQLATLEFVDNFFKHEDPAFMLDGVVTYLQHALRAGAKQRDIPFLITQSSRIFGYFNLVHENGQHIGFEETFAELQKGNANCVDTKAIRQADDLFDKFIQTPEKPAYAINNSSLGFQPRKILKKVKRIVQPNFLIPAPAIKALDREMDYEYSPGRTIVRGVRGRLRRLEQRLRNCLDKKPPLNVPFIYLPLHYTPEVSDIYFGAAFDHHAGFVSQLAKHIPSHMQLYVKEHTSMPGNRPTSFYNELNNLYNVKLLDPSVDTFCLIKNAEAIATVAGTAGWEGFLLGKPVIALGDVYFNMLPGVYKAPMDQNFAPGLLHFLRNFDNPEATRRNAYRAFFATCCFGKKGDIGENVTLADSATNSAIFAQGIHKTIEKWGHTMGGTFPPDVYENCPATTKKLPN